MMPSEERFHEVFKCRRVFLAVVHVEGASQALRNVGVARDNGAHGVFLINHDIQGQALRGIYRQVRSAHPDWWVGLNCLGLTPRRAFQTLPNDASGIWTDSLRLHLDSQQPTVLAEFMRDARDEKADLGWRGLHFGGVAFKYQPRFGSIQDEARMACLFTDVVTTSGDKTGEPPLFQKIFTIRDAIGDAKPLAIASGMTPDNVAEFLPLTDAFLVATGVSKSHTELDPALVRRFADIVRAY